jgi:hypothetical protein
VATEKSSSTQLEQWLSLVGTIAAPVTILGALLFYFGYVSAASEYAYFGLDVDTIGLSTQGFIMRSPQTLLTPLLVLTLASAVFFALNAAIHRRITSAIELMENAGDLYSTPAQHVRHVRAVTQRMRIPGMIILFIGVIMLSGYSYMRDWVFYGLVTPLLIAFGAAIIAYTSHVLSFIQRLQANQEQTTVKEGEAVRSERDQGGSSLLARRTTGVFVYVLIAASIFWATATVAQWSGRGLAHYTATHLDALPWIILDTKEFLFLHDPSVPQPELLTGSEGQTFHYRYHGLRLLIVGQNRMFLVPAQWSEYDTTLIVPLDGSMRVQFLFENEAPL